MRVRDLLLIPVVGVYLATGVVFLVSVAREHRWWWTIARSALYFGIAGLLVRYLRRQYLQVVQQDKEHLN